MSEFPKFKAEELNNQISKIEGGTDLDLIEAERDAQITDIRVRKWIKVIALIVFTAIGAGIVFSYVAHLVLPNRWRWLETSDVEAIKDLALSIATGIGLSLATKFTIK